MIVLLVAYRYIENLDLQHFSRLSLSVKCLIIEQLKELSQCITANMTTGVLEFWPEFAILFDSARNDVIPAGIYKSCLNLFK